MASLFCGNKILRRFGGWTFSLFLVACLCAAPLSAQVKIQSFNDEGVTAPCVTIGLGLLIEKKCIDMMDKAGFVRENLVGHSGLTLGNSGDQDSIITHVDAGSPAEKAGLKVGEAVVAVDGKPVKRTPGSIVEQQIFGPKDGVVHLHLLHAGAERDVEIKRAFWKVPNPPKSPSMFTTVRPMMNWRGQWMPCLSAIGPSELVVYSYCDSHYEKLGYVRLSELSNTGLTMDTDRKDAAVVKVVEPGSPAATAGVQVGDEVVSVEGKPLTASSGEWANVLLFGRIDTKHSVTVHGASGDKTLDVVLAASAADEKKAS